MRPHRTTPPPHRIATAQHHPPPQPIHSDAPVGRVLVHPSRGIPGPPNRPLVARSRQHAPSGWTRLYETYQRTRRTKTEIRFVGY
ncbi:MAG: hypothetical protein WBV42_16500 [Haladaptatus sp.]